MGENYTIVGILSKDCEVKQFESGAVKITFSVPVDKSYKDKKGEYVNITKWINCVWWNNNENAPKKLLKDTFVEIVGEPITTAYIKDSQPVAKLECKIISLRTYGLRTHKENACLTNEEQSEGLSQEADADNLPF